MREQIHTEYRRVREPGIRMALQVAPQRLDTAAIEYMGEPAGLAVDRRVR